MRAVQPSLFLPLPPVPVPNKHLCFYGRKAKRLLTYLPFYEDIHLVEFMYLVFTRMPGESYRMLPYVVALVLRISSAN